MHEEGGCLKAQHNDNEVSKLHNLVVFCAGITSKQTWPCDDPFTIEYNSLNRGCVYGDGV